MKVKDIIFELICGELSNTVIGTESTLGTNTITGKPEMKEISPNNLYKLILYINDGLNEMFSKIKLLEKQVFIEEQSWITTYYLRKQFAESYEAKHPSGRLPYIKDSKQDQFIEDFLKILFVTDEIGNTFPLNDSGSPYSLFTPIPDAITDPHPIQGRLLVVTYQASHPSLDNATFNLKMNNEEDLKKYNRELLDQEIFIPLYFVNTLKYYMAYKYFSHTNGQRELAKSQEYLSAFNADIQEAKSKDYPNNDYTISNRKFDDRGFV